MSKPLIQCPQCAGKGCIELPEEYAEVMRSIFGEGATARDLCGPCRLPDVKPTAMNNRLRRLHDMGLLTRKRHGKEFIYFRAAAPTRAER